MDVNIAKVQKEKWTRLQGLLNQVAKRRELIKHPQFVPEERQDKVHMKIYPLHTPSRVVQQKTLQNSTEAHCENNICLSDSSYHDTSINSKEISNDDLIFPRGEDEEATNIAVNIPIGLYNKLFLNKNETPVSVSAKTTTEKEIDEDNSK